VKGLKLLSLVILVGAGLVALSLSMAGETGSWAAYSSAFYGVLVTLFLVAQVWGFVISQVKYAESVEDVKFKMLENELRQSPLSSERNVT
jgi:hypothetical protein